jgi:hypothetical protein
MSLQSRLTSAFQAIGDDIQALLAQDGTLTGLNTADQTSLVNAINEVHDDEATAIHDNVAGEISAITEKITPVSGDHILIEDSAAANVKKRVQIGNLPAASEVNDLTASVTWANVPDANITQSSVTQHQAALTITESQISDLIHRDADAIHGNENGEIAAITAKATPVDGDFLIIEDSAATNAKKSITIGDLPYLSQAEVDARVQLVVDSAPAALDTLNELAAALGDDANFSTTIANQMAKRVAVDAVQTFTVGEKLQGCTNIGVGDPEHDFVTDYTTARDS